MVNTLHYDDFCQKKEDNFYFETELEDNISSVYWLTLSETIMPILKDLRYKTLRIAYDDIHEINLMEIKEIFHIRFPNTWRLIRSEYELKHENYLSQVVTMHESRLHL